MGPPGKHHARPETPEPSPDFSTTRWTLVLRARGDAPEARAALGELCESYRVPVLRFLRREDRGGDEPEELLQEFFARLLARGGFDHIDPGKGRFRSYLLGALKHFLSDHRRAAGRLKRGGGAGHESIDAHPGAGFEVADPNAGVPDEYFDRQWALAVMDRALARVEAKFATAGKSAQFESLKPWLVGDADGRGCPQSDAAAGLGMTPGAVKVAVHRLRTAFRDAVRDEITQTVGSPDEVAGELRYLVGVLSSQR